MDVLTRRRTINGCLWHRLLCIVVVVTWGVTGSLINVLTTLGTISVHYLFGSRLPVSTWLSLRPINVEIVFVLEALTLVTVVKLRYLTIWRIVAFCTVFRPMPLVVGHLSLLLSVKLGIHILWLLRRKLGIMVLFLDSLHRKISDVRPSLEIEHPSPPLVLSRHGQWQENYRLHRRSSLGPVRLTRRRSLLQPLSSLVVRLILLYITPLGGIILSAHPRGQESTVGRT